MLVEIDDDILFANDLHLLPKKQSEDLFLINQYKRRLGSIAGSHKINNPFVGNDCELQTTIYLAPRIL